MRILLVEDDPSVSRALVQLLATQGVQVDAVRTIEQACAALQGQLFDVVVLDRLLPDGDGLTVCQQARARFDSTPMVVLSGWTEEREVARAFSLGANVYLRKPVVAEELFAHLRQLQDARQGVVRVGPFELRDQRTLLLDRGEATALSPHEGRLLHELMRHPGHILSRSHLLSTVWGGAVASGNDLEVLVGKLRKKLGPHADALRTKRGEGYRLAIETGRGERPRSGVNAKLSRTLPPRASERERTG